MRNSAIICHNDTISHVTSMESLTITNLVHEADSEAMTQEIKAEAVFAIAVDKNSTDLVDQVDSFHDRKPSRSNRDDHLKNPALQNKTFTGCKRPTKYVNISHMHIIIEQNQDLPNETELSGQSG